MSIQQICSQCKELVAVNKGFSVSFYKGSQEQQFKCCSVACVDKLVKKSKSK